MKQLTQKQQRKQWAEHQATYLAAHPEQKKKKAERARKRYAAKKKALKQLRSKASAKSQSGQKVSLQQ